MATEVQGHACSRCTPNYLPHLPCGSSLADDRVSLSNDIGFRTSRIQGMASCRPRKANVPFVMVRCHARMFKPQRRDHYRPKYTETGKRGTCSKAAEQMNKCSTDVNMRVSIPENCSRCGAEVTHSVQTN